MVSHVVVLLLLLGGGGQSTDRLLPECSRSPCPAYRAQRSGSRVLTWCFGCETDKYCLTDFFGCEIDKNVG